MPETTLARREQMRLWRKNNPGYWKKWESKNKERRNAKRRTRYELQRQYLRDLKEATACADCGVNYPYYVMQFDHVHGEKKFNLSYYSGGWQGLQDELEKCEVVCANCHAIRTYRRTLT